MLLEVENLTVGYVKDVDILNGLTLRVKEGSIVTTIGPNGCGKSTLLKTIFGFLKPREGKIFFDGKDIMDLGPEDTLKCGLTYIPQETSIFPRMTVRENLEMGAFTRSDDRVKDDIENTMNEFRILNEKEKELAGNLSGGQQHLLEMARALLLSPKLIMLDEPSAGLDPIAEKYIFDRIKEISERGLTILMVEQNAKKALKMSDYGYVINLGRNEFEGTGEEVLNDERIRSAYLGTR